MNFFDIFASATSMTLVAQFLLLSLIEATEQCPSCFENSKPVFRISDKIQHYAQTPVRLLEDEAGPMRDSV